MNEAGENQNLKNVNESSKMSEILEFVNLINAVLDYYGEMGVEDDEKWKKGTELSQSNIPEDIDKEVKKAFLHQLKKFSK